MSYIDLFVFTNTPTLARDLVRAGAAGVVLDWERRGKHRRQAGADTQINNDTPADLAAVRAATSGRVVCRINAWSPWAAREIESAIDQGADELLLPMVRRGEEVDSALAAVAGRCPLGILVETVDAVRRIDDLVARPVSRVYVGLNDLLIDGDGASLFEPLVNGTADRIADAVRGAGIPFGVAGLTLPECGHPVPARLLIAALVRLGASFSFLRRSFHSDMAGRDPVIEVPRIMGAVEEARRRGPAGGAADQAELATFVELLSRERAM